MFSNMIKFIFPSHVLTSARSKRVISEYEILSIRRNQYVANIFLIIALGNIAVIAGSGFKDSAGVFIPIVLLLAGGLITYLNRNSKAIHRSPFIAVAIFGFMNIGLNMLSMMQSDEPMTDASVAFAAVFLLFPTYKPLLAFLIIALLENNIVSAQAGLGAGEIMAANIPLLIAGIIMFIITLLTERMVKDLMKRNADSEDAKRRSLKLVEELKQTIGVLGQFKQELQDVIVVTSENAEGIDNRFQSLTTGVREQVDSIHSMLETIKNTNEALGVMSAESNRMKDSSMDTVDITDSGKSTIVDTTVSMNDIQHMMEGMNASMEDLTRQNKAIGDILSTIADISSQTHLLALNAAIEAARAGEHGRGFSVVSVEVRKLAEHSGASAVQIGDILKSLQDKTHELTDRFTEVNQSLIRGNSSVHRSEEALNRISDIATQTLDRAEKVDTFSRQVKSSSDVIVAELNAIAKITQSSSDSAEQILAGVRQQRHQIEQVRNYYNRLDEAIRNLEQLANAENVEQSV